MNVSSVQTKTKKSLDLMCETSNVNKINITSVDTSLVSAKDPCGTVDISADQENSFENESIVSEKNYLRIANLLENCVNKVDNAKLPLIERTAKETLKDEILLKKKEGYVNQNCFEILNEKSYSSKSEILKTEITNKTDDHSSTKKASTSDFYVYIKCVIIRQLNEEYVCVYANSLPISHFFVDLKVFQECPKPGVWFQLKIAKEDMSQNIHSDKSIKVLTAFSIKPLLVPIVRLQKTGDEIEILTELIIGKKTAYGFRHCYSHELRNVVDTLNLLKKFVTGSRILAWCSLRKISLIEVVWKVVTVEKIIENKIDTRKTKLCCEEQNAELNNLTLQLEQVKVSQCQLPEETIKNTIVEKFAEKDVEQKGLICLRYEESLYCEHADYLVHCFKLKKCMVLKAELVNKQHENENYFKNLVGQWITFTASFSEIQDDVLLIKNYQLIIPRYKTMPTYDMILISCQIKVPNEFDIYLPEKTPVSSQFVAEIYDTNSLIKAKHVGKILPAVIGFHLSFYKQFDKPEKAIKAEAMINKASAWQIVHLETGP